MPMRRPHIKEMRQLLTPILLVLALSVPAPVLAQTVPDDREDGLSLLERGMKLLFEELLQEMEPALGEMAEAMKELEPMARELARMIGDVRNYEPPEQLPNGDIIIRRKPGAPPPPKLPVPDANPPVDQSPTGEIEL